jgi:two-component system response regulator PilR (NtrC family)
MSATPPLSLLIIEDEPDLRTLYELSLVREGYDIETASSVGQACALLRERSFSAVITDMRLPDGTGLDILNFLEGHSRHEKAIVITAYGSAENAVEALKAGAYDYLTKPVDLKQFRAVVASALGRGPSTAPSGVASGLSAQRAVAPPAPVTSGAAQAVAASPQASAHSGPSSPALRRMAGASAAMAQVRMLVGKVARSMAPVLVQGESGTGKELVARAIHEVSSRHAHPFIAVNCGAIPENLLEAEFFGYRRGAFTGANEDREGFFQAADGGTLFLDEIGDLPLSMQSKLLRAVQERSVRPVGAVSEVTANVRLLSATHKDLAAEVHAGRFRQDLYYRLNVIQIRVPPLRERLEDLASIGAHFLERIAREAGVWPAPSLTEQALLHLSQHPFPGNVRELENLLHRAVALSGGELIDAADLGLPVETAPDGAPSGFGALADAALADSRPSSMAGVFAAPPQPADAELPTDLAVHLDEIERDILWRALERHRFNRTAAGASLGLSLRQMRYRMARLQVMAGLDAPVPPDADADSERGGT